MTQTGFVEKINGDLALIKIHRSSSCGDNCASCGACNAKEMMIEAKNSIGAKAGDTVSVKMNDKNILEAAFLVYIIPIIMLIFGYFLGQHFTNNENIGILLGFLLLAISFAAIIGIDKKLKNKYCVYIDKILDK